MNETNFLSLVLFSNYFEFWFMVVENKVTIKDYLA